MAITTIRTTYALDEATVKKLDELARRWNVSKSQALRRAIQITAGRQPSEGRRKLGVLDELQASLRLKPAQAKAWTRRVRGERQASSVRLETDET